MVARNRLAEGVGLIAGFAALAMGGMAAGLELERRLVSKRIGRSSQAELEQFFALRSDGPTVTTADGVVLHTEVDEGPAEDFTLVWVHGYALNLDYWHFQRQHFRGRVRQVFYDLRSHGRSSRSAPEHCRLDQLADDLDQVLDEVAGAGPVVLVGHSMGGMTIMRLAQSRPELFGTRVVGVGLLHTSAGEMADHSPIRGLPGRTFSRVAEPLMASLNRIPELVQRTRQAGSDLATWRPGGWPSPPTSRPATSSTSARCWPRRRWRWWPTSTRRSTSWTSTQALAGLSRLPVVVIGGEDDLFTPVAHTDRITELLPDAVTLRLPDCGHLGMIEHPDRSTQVLEAAGPGPRRPLTARPAAGPRRPPRWPAPKAATGGSRGSSTATPKQKTANPVSPRRTPSSRTIAAADPSCARTNAQMTLTATGNGVRMPARAGPSTPAAPVTARTSAAVARARAGRSHHGQCSMAGPWSVMRRRSRAATPCTAATASTRPTAAGRRTRYKARSAASTASQLRARVAGQGTAAAPPRRR